MYAPEMSSGQKWRRPRMHECMNVQRFETFAKKTIFSQIEKFLSKSAKIFSGQGPKYVYKKFKKIFF